MVKVIGSDLKKARVLVLDMKTSLSAAMDDATGADLDVLSDAYDALCVAYDGLCDATEVLSK